MSRTKFKESDPKPSVDRVQELASRIIQGDILLPKFQRSFVWDRQQILDLLDSIAKNYPIGSVLFWLSRQRLASERTIADLPIKERPPEYPVNYLLDGQQRLSTICGTLYWDGKNKDSIWNIAYDLRKEEFVHLDTLDLPAPHFIRLNKIPDPAAYFAHTATFRSLKLPDAEELEERAKELFNRFVDYKIATVTLGDMPLEAVAPIFERINSTGTPLKMVDLMRAATWSPEFDLIDTIDGVILENIAESFGLIDRNAVLRSLSASAGGGFSRTSIDELREYGADKLNKAARETRAAYERAVDFFMREIGAPNGRIIPYINQIVVVAEFFRVNPNPSHGHLVCLKQWFWRTSVSSYFRGWNTGQMATDQEAIQKFALGSGEQDIECAATPPGADIWKLRQFRANTAISKVLGLVLAQENPLDFRNGSKVDVSPALAWNNEAEYHHIFPQAYLKEIGVSWQKAAALANIAIITSATNKWISKRKPSEYFGEMRAELGSNFENVVASHFIDDKALTAIFADDYEGFLEARADRIHFRVSELANWRQ